MADRDALKQGDAVREHADGSGFRIAILVVALAIGFAAIPRVVSRFAGQLSIDEPAPAFTAKVVANADALDGKHTISLADLQGKPVILDFWATWCGPCQAESPIVNAIAQRYRDKGLVVIGVNTSDQAGLAAIFAKQKRLTFPMVYDEGNVVARDFNVDTLPTLVVISRGGRIVAVRHGVTSDSDLDGLVRRIL